jgi:hypothetical protein
MIFPDRSPARSLARVWLAVGRRLAVAAGASTALVCLLCHNSLLTASLRGALALVAASIVVRIGHTALSAVHAPQRVAQPREPAKRK